MSNCDKLINQAINANCETPALITGLEDIAVLINRADIDFSGIDLSVVPHAPFASIPFLSGKSGFMVKQINDSFKGTKSEMQKSRFRNNFHNSFNFMVFDKLGQPVTGSTAVATVTVTGGANNYVVGDLLYLGDCTTGKGTLGNQAIVKVTALVGAAGTAISTVALVYGGSGYTAALMTTTTNSVLGTGATITVATLTTSVTPVATTSMINQLANGRFVVVYQNRTKNVLGDINYEIMGLYRGLKVSKLETDRYNEETNGAWIVEMDEEGVAEGPIPFASTTRALTDAAFNALCVMY